MNVHAHAWVQSPRRVSLHLHYYPSSIFVYLSVLINRCQFFVCALDGEKRTCVIKLINQILITVHFSTNI